MKIKSIILTAAVAMLATMASAQELSLSPEMRSAYRQQFHQREPEQQLKSNIPLSATVQKPGVKSVAQKNLPTDRVWFPGEWEEVKAIVVTPSYYFIPWPQTAENQNYIADPIVSHYAE